MFYCKRKIWLIVALCGILFIMIAIMHTNQQCSLLAFMSQIPISALVRAELQSPPATAIKPKSVVCACLTCVADKGNLWFDQRYDSQLQPFLSAQNTSLPPLTLKWWMKIQHSPPEPPLEEVIRKMFEVISSPLPNWTPHQDKCRRCAVVGNSGNLLGSNFGPLIDSHTNVIRMNRATTSGYERDVGNRTTHHVMYPESAVNLRPGVHLVLLPFKPRDMQWVASALTTGGITMTYMRVKEFVKADKDKVFVVNPTLMKYTYDKWTEHYGKYPSTGMLAIITALHICDEVSVFGYGADKNGNWHHYWENINGGAFRKTGVHNADFEIQVIQKLAAVGKIQLHTR